MEHSLHRFILFIQYEKRFSAHTVTAYRDDLHQFAGYLQKQFEVTELSAISHSFIRSWIVSLLEETYSSRAVNRKISALRTFFRFLMREKLISENPMLKVTAPKNSKKLPVFVEQANMDTLFNHVAVEPDYEGQRDRMILELFYATGMRLSELLNLKHQDLDLYNQSVKVLGKRNKERIIPLGKHIVQALTDFISKKKELFPPENSTEGFLFLTRKGAKMSPKAVYLLVRKYLSLVTTIEKKSPHVLRHTFATHLLNNGADINVIKEILGHSSLAATQVYTHNTIEKLKEAHRLAHPKP